MRSARRGATVMRTVGLSATITGIAVMSFGTLRLS
jgi:hypothetical protein